MTTRVVCDASVVIAALLDSGPDGQWATGQLSGCELFAPDLLPYEGANVLRRLESSKAISHDQAALAYADLLELHVELWPSEPLAARVWALRHNLTSYDAAYVALAETLSSPLLTLDRRIARSPGPECVITTRT